MAKIVARNWRFPTIGFATHTGGRENNEDGLLAARTKKGILLAVADGLGGHAGGEVASALALRALAEKQNDDLRVAINHAHNKIVAQQPSQIIAKEAKNRSKDEEAKLMATTLTAVHIAGSQAHFGHVGDSKLFLFRSNKISQLSEDHTAAQEMRKHGMVNIPAQAEHRLSQSLGIFKPVPQIGNTQLEKGDVLLLCTDGLTASVTQNRIKAICLTLPPLKAVQMLIKTANEQGKTVYKGKHDNITAIVYRHE